MALIKCSECGHDVSTLADRCPNCGAPVMAQERRPPGSVRPALPDEEQVIFRTRLHWISFATPVVAVLLAIGVALMVINAPRPVPVPLPGVERGLQTAACVLGFVSLFWFGARFLAWVSSSVTLTDRRLAAQEGVLSRHSTDIPLSKIESVSVDQGLGGRLFGYGTVVVTGSGGTQERFHDIASARSLSSAVQMQVSARRV